MANEKDAVTPDDVSPVEEELQETLPLEEEAEAVAEGEEAAAGDDLQAQLEAANARADENWDRLVRMQAEMDNLRKRNQRDIENAHKFALDKIANELLGVRDSLESAIQASESDDADVAKLQEGNQLIYKQLTATMEKFNIVEVNPEGEKFNPDMHQAMSMQEVPDTEPNTVIGVMQKGYTLNDRLLRPALVMVSK